MPITILAEDGDSVYVGDWAIRWGNANGLPSFEPDTNLMIDWISRKPIFLDHATYSDDILGNSLAEHVEPSIGVYVAAELDSRLPGVKAMLPDIRAGLYAWSSATHPALYKAANGQITRFPILEYSVTKFPADPRHLGRKAFVPPPAPNPTDRLRFQYQKGAFWLYGSPYSRSDVIALHAANWKITVVSSEPLELTGFEHLLINLK